MPGTHIKGVLVNRGIKSNNAINSTVELSNKILIGEFILA